MKIPRRCSVTVSKATTMTTHRSPVPLPSAFARRRFDEENRTVEAVVSTGAGYPRRGGTRNGHSYIEMLDLSAIDPASLIGIPLLDAHNQSTVRAVIGKVIAARHSALGILATLQFSRSPDVDPIFDRVRDGTLGGVTIGYTVQKWNERVSAGDNVVRTAANGKSMKSALFLFQRTTAQE